MIAPTGGAMTHYLVTSMHKTMDIHTFTPYPYPTHIDKEVLGAMPRASFEGRIHIIDKVSQVKGAVKNLHQHSLLGIDTETKPVFVPGKRAQVALLQISSEHDCYLFRLNMIGIPTPLIELLEDVSILKIGLGLQDDLTGLRRVERFEGAGFVELQRLCIGYGIRDASLQKIYGIIYGEFISKSQQMTNWEARELKPAQQAYASLDAWACLRIYQKLCTHPTPHPTQFAIL